MKLHDVKKASYLLSLLADHKEMRTNYLTKETLFQLAVSKAPNLLYEEFEQDFETLKLLNYIKENDEYCCLTLKHRQETVLAQNLADYLTNNQSESWSDINVERLNPFYNSKQKAAIKMALTHRLSLITGHAGTGKTTLITTLGSFFTDEKGVIIYSPLQQSILSTRKGWRKKPLFYRPSEGGDDFLVDADWGELDLILIDNAELITEQELCSILYNAPYDCNIVLLGDEAQAESNETGSVFQDLITLGFPVTNLTTQYRFPNHSALAENIEGFADINNFKDLSLDMSFEFIACDKASAKELITSKASEYLLSEIDTQVITNFTGKDELSVENLNVCIKGAYNPVEGILTTLHYSGFTYSNGDRVKLTEEAHFDLFENEYIRTLLIGDPSIKPFNYAIRRGYGSVDYIEKEDFTLFRPGYTLSPVQAAGCSYDYVIIPIFDEPNGFFNRSQLYSAISRSREKVILIGDPKAFDKALKRVSGKEISNLVGRVRFLQHSKLANVSDNSHE